MDVSDQPKDAGTGQQSTTRRAFLGGAGRKALYVTPAVLTLAGQQAFASGPVCGSSFKHEVGSPCSVNGDYAEQCCDVDYGGQPLTCVVPDGEQVGTCQHP